MADMKSVGKIKVWQLKGMYKLGLYVTGEIQAKLK